MLTEKELLLMEDFLNAAQSSSDSMNNLANSLQDAQTKQLFQQISQKNSQNAQMISKHLNAGQNIQ
ncbi:MULTISPECIES: ferritin-like domain-containing protein [Anaerosinus]|uniref:Ferritin-like domain-containing protein n=1 Tax=Selenobaculum gibii TaxID=3054208 RepID=A0A9Y2AJC6_9FIRM|nr:ferritin-like domain-containing protein [Selenobaculum gbiensis]WIW71126.1 ferritin-like domain-containing protein [Selenobaculum gbiensis]